MAKDKGSLLGEADFKNAVQGRAATPGTLTQTHEAPMKKPPTVKRGKKKKGKRPPPAESMYG